MFSYPATNVESSLVAKFESGEDRWWIFAPRSRLVLNSFNYNYGIFWGNLYIRMTQGWIGICALGKHSIDAYGFPYCRMTFDFLFEKELIHACINSVGKDVQNTLGYACCVTLPIKRMATRGFVGCTCLWTSRWSPIEQGDGDFSKIIIDQSITIMNTTKIHDRKIDS
jgi:hypothetical protein